MNGLTSIVVTNINRLTSISILIITFLFVSQTSYAQTINVAVIYPEVEHPYSEIFASIINGITTEKRLQVHSYKINDNTQNDVITKWLENNQTDVVISLGQKSIDTISTLSLDIPSIISGVIRPVKPHRCICLNIAPGILFRHLLELKPDLERIFFVYSERNNGWLIPAAKSAAKKAGIKLIAKAAENVQAAAQHYKSILENKPDPRDAIWLPLDNILPSDVILPALLKSAWDNKYVVFSTTPFYVKRGGLFALFPDHFKLGQQIAESALQASHTKIQHHMHARHFKSSINIRTARHLSLQISNNELKKYDIIYPVR